jgi:hypothetical protein
MENLRLVYRMGLEFMELILNRAGVGIFSCISGKNNL